MQVPVRPAPSGRISGDSTRSSLAQISATPKVCPTCGVRYPIEFSVCPRDAVGLQDAEDHALDDDMVGATLGNTFTIIKVIGEGGMGRVYEARHTRISGKRFALKMLHAEFIRQV